MSNIEKAFVWATKTDLCTLPDNELEGDTPHRVVLVILFLLMSPVYILLFTSVMWLAIIGDMYNVIYRMVTKCLP